GKINLPDSILRKRGRLDAEERALMMTHPVVAADVLQRFKPLTDLAPIVRAHHEWFNGEGYPDGLKAEAIPIETRIISVVNAFFSVADSRELRIIYRIAQETTAVLDLDTLLSRIVTIIRDVMGYYMVSILLPVNDASELRVGAHSGYAVNITGLTIAVGEGITGWVYKNAVPHIVPDVHEDPRYIGLDDQARSELAFPLMSRGRVVGVLNAESQHADAFSEADVALMSAVGSQLASCLEVAQLHDTLKREASHDPLTRLNNRRHFLERIQHEITRAAATGETF